ncbi:hypothetical protein GPZ77_34215 (plasmid) [Streptomyces sp. QHH-9511]|uniref:hypothetical protein n=1 Tax=Streptomyces sp. QHH-9511 TaxID=2684468 RepID=UPI001318D9A1|nr:hypothetical protein [Streptomyces sp. QHH-9511]QGZ53287.1 hypothetical protein GPZ77_34215 [Streptomyces sp. QHH-9511]
MSLMTIAPAITDGQDPAFFAGRADAYDEHTDGATIAQLQTRADYITDLHDPQYAAGYTARLHEIRRETAALTAAQTDTAHEQNPERAA